MSERKMHNSSDCYKNDKDKHKKRRRKTHGKRHGKRKHKERHDERRERDQVKVRSWEAKSCEKAKSWEVKSWEVKSDETKSCEKESCEPKPYDCGDCDSFKFSSCDPCSDSCESSSHSKSQDSEKPCETTEYDSCEVVNSESVCFDIKNDICDVSDDDDVCYDPDKRIPCPEDCLPEKCENFNIYWFGSSYTDVGNGRLNIGIEPYTINTTSLGLCGDLVTGAGPCGRSSDGKVYPQFVASDMDYEVQMEYDLDSLPECRDSLASFAISGATQTGNTNPTVPDGLFGFNWQVDRYLELYEESECFSIPEKDLFMYTCVGGNDFIELLLSIAAGEPLNPILFFQSYKQAVIDNIVKLYSLGKSRRMIVVLTSAYLIDQTPASEKIRCAMGEVAYNALLNLFAQCQEQLKQQLEAFAQSQPHFDLTVFTDEGVFRDIIENHETYGIILEPTMIDLGWPDKIFENQLWFDDIHPSSHTHRIIANFAKTWFQQKICY